MEHEPRPEHWSYEEFRNCILTACRDGQAGLSSFERLPQAIDFGVIGERLLKIPEQQDTTAREYAIEMLYDPGTHGIRLSKAEIHGEQAKVQIRNRILPRQELVAGLSSSEQAIYQLALVKYNQSSFAERDALLLSDHPFGKILRATAAAPAGYLHTHTSRNPFSGGDVSTFLATPVVRTAGLLMIDGRLAILVRSHETPTLPPHEVSAKTEQWHGQMQKRLNENPVATEVEFLAQQARTVHAMAKTLAKKYQFGYYISNEPKSTALKRAV